MSAIASNRPFFPPQSGQGGAAPVNATKVLREAQAAFFRPSTATPAPAPEPEQVEETAPVAPAIRRPGSLLDIRV
ncbi:MULTISPECIES: hypothetical protein [unclassified Brevundimonas]|uniref:hypothetical protein n=1 Tax=unclassified Brevundimonas TaxID=2622653 RepID=UPI0025BD8AB7|nr:MULTISPECIES: hypothetical protein [unclassified Brevundimonas]